MLLDGNINPTEYYHGLYDESNAGLDPSLNEFFRACYGAGPEYCPIAEYGRSSDDLAEKFQKIQQAAASGKSSYTIDQYTALEDELWEGLSHPSPPGYYLAAASLAAAWEQLRESSAPLDESNGEDAVQDTNNMAFWAINCGDWDDIPGTPEDWSGWQNLYNSRSSWGQAIQIDLLYSCSAWQLNAREKYRGPWANIRTKHPILFVNSNYDPRTPVESAMNASAGFPGSKVLRHNGPGHGHMESPSNCTTKAIKQYWLTGTMPDVTQPCEPNQNAFISSYETFVEAADSPDQRRKRGAKKRYEYPDILYQMAAENEHLFQTSYSYSQSACPIMTSGPAANSPAGSSPVAGVPSDSIGDSDKLIDQDRPSNPDQQIDLSAFNQACNGVGGSSWVLKLMCSALTRATGHDGPGI